MKHEIRSALWRLVFYALVLEGLLAAAILFWPDFRDNQPAILSLTKKIPAIQRFSAGMMDSGIQGYVCGQHYFKACCTLGVAAAILFAMGAVAGEVHRGTLELWLARPVTRKRLLTERWLLGALTVVLPIFATSASIPWLLSRVGETMEQSDLLLCSTLQGSFLLAIYSVTFLWSVLGRQPVTIAFGMMIACIGQFALFFVKDATHWSFYRLVDFRTFPKICAQDALPVDSMTWLVGIIAVTFVASLFLFERRTP